MPKIQSLQPFAAVIVAAGKGSRSGQSRPKQFVTWRGKPLLRHSAEALVQAGASPLVVAIPESTEGFGYDALSGLTGVRFVRGGETRQQSVRIALDEMQDDKPNFVLIHDAARPDLPIEVIQRLVAALDKHPAAIPVLPMVDSLVIESAGMMAGKGDRDILKRVQTPQAFRFNEILSAHHAWKGAPDAGDDAQVACQAGLPVALVEGDERLRKLTFAGDFMEDLAPIRVGTGFDVHRLGKGEELWLCGVHIEHDVGLVGHSDADVATHALVDSLLGAIGAGDIGMHFPPSDSRWKDAPSSAFLQYATKLVAKAGYRIGNVDLTILCENPRIGPYREAMRAKLSEIMGVDIGAVSVKATTTERLGFAGRGEGIAAQASATLLRTV